MNNDVCTSTYQFRVYLPRGETYAFRLDGSDVTGVCGPLDYSEMHRSALPTFQYEKQLCDLTWVKANISDFIVCEGECAENAIWI